MRSLQIRSVRAIIALITVLVCAGPAWADGAVAYDVYPNFTTTPRRLDIVMRFSVGDAQGPISLQIPVWAPGDYHVLNFQNYVTDVAVHAGTGAQGAPIAVQHTDSQTWTFDPAGADSVTVAYSVSQQPPGYFSENVLISDHQIFVNGPAAYLYIENGKDRPARLTLHVPDGWHAEMTEVGEPHKSGNALTVNANDYDTLADSPFVATPSAEMATRDFTIGKTHFRAVFFDHPQDIKNPDQVADTLKAVVTAEGEIMHGIPTTQYKFLFDVDGPGGGLEHLNCTRIALPANIPPQFLAPFAGHEAFHMWNVKRIRPFVLGPFDYVTPPVTRNLWFAEGVTEYYAHVATRRAGITSEAQFLAHWRQVVRSFGRNRNRTTISADDSSRRVWEAGNSEGYGISYYTKGELVGLCLDLKIRHITQNRKSLDDVMGLLMSRNGLPKPGYQEDGIREAVSEVAGTDLGAFYDLLARSTEEMPFAECLGYAGLTATCDPIADAPADALVLRKNWTAAFQPEVK